MCLFLGQGEVIERNPSCLKVSKQKAFDRTVGLMVVKLSTSAAVFHGRLSIGAGTGGFLKKQSVLIHENPRSTGSNPSHLRQLSLPNQSLYPLVYNRRFGPSGSVVMNRFTATSTVTDLDTLVQGIDVVEEMDLVDD
ncbi:hypothetical protein PGTUg99_005257 [Puccinia graminis f. sp. tritici]|uniref:Uncharacterized protein n=1 Tax=Puccinia graminis f. sp. tritici TaxID=56615 RepID=A0A5B0NNX2_PUCGR|nr:hypothetical protein PGTUg99_005257 [Puccinia graminis f. sp. tritici]